jgi:hypothetical protein
MSIRTFETTQAKLLPFTSRGFASANSARCLGTENPESSSDRLPRAAGCVRGLCWAIAIEAILGISLFVLWRFHHLAW